MISVAVNIWSGIYQIPGGGAFANWILRTGFWFDGGEWIDGASWID